MSSIRKRFIMVTGIAAMGAASLTSAAGNIGSMAERVRGGASDSGSSSQQSSAPVYAPAPAPAAAPAPRAQESRPNFRNAEPRVERQVGPSPPDTRATAPNVRPDSGNRENARNTVTNPRGNGRGVIGGAVSRNFPADQGGANNGGSNHGDRRHSRSPRVVYVLPPYYNDYYWNNTRYYNFDGGWYSPYGNSYISVGAPYGMFVSSLPGYSSSFYYGDVRYYRNDDTYYTYDRSRGGYLVAPSPYSDEEEDSDAVDEDLYVYPAQGQSEQLQADDRYACHRWGVKESGYDPIDDDYDRDRRANYLRAMTACLSGRGYTVK
ncbi:MAG: DUF6515 family protein [Pseudomonadota bacterium]